MKMMYCLECGKWHKWESTLKCIDCPHCFGENVIEPLAERSEWMDRVEALTLKNDKLTEVIDKLTEKDGA
jgi:hypothetical protein